MKYLALTGGIGSGKSYVAQLLAERGLPVYHADAAAKRLMTEDPALRQALTAAFGPDTYIDGVLNRPYLAERVFSDAVALRQLNALVHPAVWADSEAWLARQRAGSHAPFAIHEAAIVFELGAEGRYDGVILVTAPQEVRVARVMARDGASAEAVQQRMAAQWPDEAKVPLAQFVIINDGRDLEPQLVAMFEQFGAGPAKL